MSELHKWFIVPDLHIPHHDRKKWAIVKRIIEDWQPNTLSLIGDFDDAAGPSRWSKDTTEEVEARLSKVTKEVNDELAVLRAMVPDARMTWNLGNHEQRWMDYVSKNAKVLDGWFSWDKIYDVEKLGIELYEYGAPPVKMYGGFYLHHGSVVTKHTGQSAKGEMDTYGVSGFSGHTHRAGSFAKTDMTGTKFWLEVGHLLDINQVTYTAAPNWQHAFAYAYVDKKSNKVYPFISYFQGNSVVFEGNLYK